VDHLWRPRRSVCSIIGFSRTSSFFLCVFVFSSFSRFEDDHLGERRLVGRFANAADSKKIRGVRERYVSKDG